MKEFVRFEWTRRSVWGRTSRLLSACCVSQVDEGVSDEDHMH